MKIKYSYEIKDVDEINKVMTIEYYSKEHGSMLVGAHIPRIDESLEDVVRSYSPVNEWILNSKPTQKVFSGMSGNMEFSYDEEYEDTVLSENEPEDLI